MPSDTDDDARISGIMAKKPYSCGFFVTRSTSCAVECLGSHWTHPKCGQVTMETKQTVCKTKEAGKKNDGDAPSKA